MTVAIVAFALCAQAPGAAPESANAQPAIAAATPAPAGATDTGMRTYLDLVTIGPGEQLWTSFGHVALVVMHFDPATKQGTTAAYNWGDADFGGFDFVWSFFVGKAVFRLTKMGTIEDVVNTYAVLDRTMVQQRFALTDAQAEKAAARLEFLSAPERREYIYHHIDASCATKVRDFIDQDVVDGAIAEQLGDTVDPHTPRYYGRKNFAGYFFAEIFGDLFMGRLHDQPWTKYAAMTVPTNLAAYLQEVRVADPNGGGAEVALLSTPRPIVHDVRAPPYRGEGRTTIHLTYILGALVLLMGIYTVRRKRIALEDAGFWLALWAVPAAAGAVCMVFGALVSHVAEGRINELMIVYPATDIVLLPVALLWWRRKPYAPRWLRIYAWVRLGLVGVSVLGHWSGLLYQEPRVLVGFAALCSISLLVILRRLVAALHGAATVAQPEPAASADAA